MTKNYVTSSNREKTKITPHQHTITFLLNYSKSFDIDKSKYIDEIRFDKN